MPSNVNPNAIVPKIMLAPLPVTDATTPRLEKAMDLDSDGGLDYISEFGSGPQFGKLLGQSGPMSAEDVARAFEHRKAILGPAIDAARSETYAQAEEQGFSPPYHFGFFDASQYTMKDEVRSLAAFAKTFDAMKNFRAVIDKAEKDKNGQLTWPGFEDAFQEIVTKLSIRPPRLLHGSSFSSP